MITLHLADCCDSSPSQTSACGTYAANSRNFDLPAPESKQILRVWHWMSKLYTLNLTRCTLVIAKPYIKLQGVDICCLLVCSILHIGPDCSPSYAHEPYPQLLLATQNKQSDCTSPRTKICKPDLQPCFSPNFKP